MNLHEILERLEPTDLERLAADKLPSGKHVRLPPSVLRSEVESVLKSFSYVQKSLSERHPPSFALLTLLLDSPDFSLAVSELRARVEDETARLCERAAREEGLVPGKQYGLYRRILAEAWRSDLVIEAAEAALLSALRRELSITYREHTFLAHHPDLQPFWRSERAFERERNALLGSGLLFAVDDRYVVAAEIAPLIRASWELHLSAAATKRLYAELSTTELSDALRELGLPSSGSKDDKISTLANSLVSPKEVLGVLNLTTTLRNIAKKTGCVSSGAKDELIERLVEHFADDGDLAHAAHEQALAAPEAPVHVEPQAKALSEPSFRSLFGRLTGEELYEVLSGLPSLRLSGSKDVRISTLWASPFAEASLLATLTNRTLSLLLERCALKTSGPKDEKVQRLIDLARGMPAESRAVAPTPTETAPRADLATDVRGTVAPGPEPARTDEILAKYPFLDREQAVVLALLQEFQSLTDLELERLSARYDLQWYFIREEMRRLAITLRENGAPLVEHREAVEHDIYLFRGAA